ncbi:MAG: hypothetical protein RJA00_1737 [Bacteroidota bacterium]
MLVVGESGRNFHCHEGFWGSVGELYLWYMQKGMKSVLVVVLLVGLSTLEAQTFPSPSTNLKPKMWGVGVNVRHFGYDFGLVKSQSAAAYLNTSALWFGVMRDPREMKVINERLPGSSAFAIERVTHNLSLRYQKGKSIVLSERNSRGDVGLRLNASLQLPVDYAWPTYIWLYDPVPLTDGYTAVAYDPAIHDVGLIGGTAGYGLGFSDGQLIPGFGGLVAMQAEWGSYRNVSNTLTLGFGADRFVKKLPFWHRPEMNRNFFPSVFVTFAVGFEYGQGH